VLTLSVEMCYQALGVIHHLWHPHDDRIRDYIATPKVNGYRSLHTAVFALDGRLAQIHIRTHAMHRSAKHGVAAFWLERAALGATVDPQTPLKAEDVPTWVTQLATWHNELGLSAADFVATLRGDLLEEQIFVFTPKGDIRELPAGSTVLDLAYAIHTKVGDHAVAAWVQTNTSQGVLIACDREPARLNLLEENLARLGVRIAKIVCHDWMKSAVPPEILSTAPFDRILIDAPCTNTGVMRRRVDVRWRLKPADFNRMHTRQTEITRAVIPLLKPGGILVYSTCSLEREENEDVVQSLLRTMSTLQLEEERRSIPFQDNFDGAFGVRFRRKD